MVCPSLAVVAQLALPVLVALQETRARQELRAILEQLELLVLKVTRVIRRVQQEPLERKVQLGRRVIQVQQELQALVPQARLVYKVLLDLQKLQLVLQPQSTQSLVHYGITQTMIYCMFGSIINLIHSG
jgi:hypothetical protein